MHRGGMLLLSLLSVAACSKKSARADNETVKVESGAAPAADFAYGDVAAGAAVDESDREYENAEPSFEELQARFDQLDADLSSQGILGATGASTATAGGTSVPQPKPAPPKKEVEDRCERICSLSGAICEVSERICGLAETHEDDSKYTDACTRSETRCTEATTACSTCAE